LLKIGAFGAALAEQDYWYKPWYNEIFTPKNKNPNSTHEHHKTIDGKDPEAKFARKCMSKSFKIS